MQVSSVAVWTILGMAAITYLLRISGVWLMSHVRISPRLQGWMDTLPGTILVAIVAPTVLGTGLAEVGAALATLLVAMRTRNLLLSLLTGVSVVLILRLAIQHF